MEQLTVDLASARDAAFDWQAEDAVARELQPHMRLATGMNAVIAVYRAIDEGVFPGHKLSWPTTIACATKAQARRFMEKSGWTVTPDFEALPEDEPYYFLVTDES